MVLSLIYIFCLPISCCKLYNKGAFSYVFTIKTMCHLGWVQKNLTLKENIKWKQCLYGYFLIHMPKYVGIQKKYSFEFFSKIQLICHMLDFDCACVRI